MATLPKNPNEIANVVCPLCASPMQWRKRRSDGQLFMGCTAYPNCNGTRDAEGISHSVGRAATIQQLQRILKAAVLQSEDEAITYTEQQLVEADQYQLEINYIAEENSYVTTLVKKP